MSENEDDLARVLGPVEEGETPFASLKEALTGFCKKVDGRVPIERVLPALFVPNSCRAKPPSSECINEGLCQGFCKR